MKHMESGIAKVGTERNINKSYMYNKTMYQTLCYGNNMKINNTFSGVFVLITNSIGKKIAKKIFG